MTHNEFDEDLVLKAMCCVVAADGHVSSREIAVIAEALTQAGFPTKPEEIRPTVIKLAKQIYLAGPSLYVESIVQQVAGLGGTAKARLLSSALDTLIRADGQTVEPEATILHNLRKALDDASAATDQGCEASARVTALPSSRPRLSYAQILMDTVLPIPAGSSRPRLWYAQILISWGVWALALLALLLACYWAQSDRESHNWSLEKDTTQYGYKIDLADAAESNYRKSGTAEDLFAWLKQADEAAENAKLLHSRMKVEFAGTFSFYVACFGAIVVCVVVLMFLCYGVGVGIGDNKLVSLGLSAISLSAISLMLPVCCLSLFYNARWYSQEEAGPVETASMVSKAAKHVEAILAERLRRGESFESLTGGGKDTFWTMHKEVVARGDSGVEGHFRFLEQQSHRDRGVSFIDDRAEERARAIAYLVEEGAMLSGKAADVARVSGKGADRRKTDVIRMLTSTGWLRGDGRVWRFQPGGQVVYEEPGGTVDESRKWTLLERNEDKNFITVMVSDVIGGDAAEHRRWEFVIELYGSVPVARVKIFRQSEVVSDGIFTPVR